jgi:hypothetical protein
LHNLSEPETEPEANATIQERFIKALQYFSEQTTNTINKPYKAFNYTTDNKAVEKDINKQLAIIEDFLATKLSYFKGLAEGFNTHKFLELRANAVFLTKEKPKKSRTTVIEGTTNTGLFERLRNLRNTIADENDLIHYQIFTQKALYELCETLPTNKKELLKVTGFGKIRVEKYGTAILKVIEDYCNENEIEILKHTAFFEGKIPKLQKGGTKKVSLELYKSGKTVFEIAKERSLSTGTITEHLAFFIPSKEVKITDLISEIHYKELKELIPKMAFENLSDLKHQIDEKYSYTDLRLVLNDLNNE